MWRKFIPENWQEGVTKKDYWEQVNAYSEMAVDIALKERPKLVELIEQIATITNPARSRLLAYLTSTEILELSESERQPIWEALTKLSSMQPLVCSCRLGYGCSYGVQAGRGGREIGSAITAA